MKVISIVFFLCFITTGMLAHADFPLLEKEMAYHADVMINASKAEHRVQAESNFRKAFIKALKIDGSFSYPFDSLKWISKVEPADSTFRLFTWQLVFSVDSVRYFGLAQMSNQELIIFNDQSIPDEDFLYETLSAEQWYGQVYTDIYHYQVEGKSQYILFGRRLKDEKTLQKIAEPVYFDETGMYFGKEVFYKASARHGEYRIFIEYFSRAKASLEFDPELGLIVFDHLVPVVNPYESNDYIHVPEGTFEGYKLDGSRWIYQDRVFNQIYEKPPVPEPILNKRDKDIFGK